MSPTSLSHARLLLVDDDEEACRLLAEVLEREAYDVVPRSRRTRRSPWWSGRGPSTPC